MRKIIFIASLLFTLSCDKTDINTELIENATIEDKDKNTVPDEGEMILSDKVTNPYEIKNMRVALKSMKQKVAEAKDIEIEPNYKYVRFLPSNRGEYDLINGNPDIDVFEYPLDRKIIKKGNKYIDKSLGNSEFGWIYSAVPIDMKFDSKIKLEIIDLLFLPDGNGRTDEYSRSLDSKGQSHKNLMKELEKESLNIHGDEKYGIVQSGKSAKIADRYSSGRIRVQDERMSYNESTNQYQAGAGWVPVPGCQVRGNRWFTTKTAISSENGTFFINHGWPNGSSVDMDIKWDRDGFDIRSGNYGQAITSNQNISGPWFPNITKSISPEHFIYAHVHRAAYTYYYKNSTWGIQAPPDNNYFNLLGPTSLLFGHKMHIGAKSETCNNWIYPDVFECRAHYYDWNDNFFAAEIRMPFNLSTVSSRGIFATTIHELAHASHWKMGFSTALYAAHINNRKLAESWAQAVGWKITNDVYFPDQFAPNVDPEALQYLSLTFIQTGSNREYTPLFIDLIDNFSQGTINSNRPFETVRGYTLGQLELFLKQKPANWYQLRDYIVANNVANPLDPNSQNDTQTLNLFNEYDN